MKIKIIINIFNYILFNRYLYYNQIKKIQQGIGNLSNLKILYVK